MVDDWLAHTPRDVIAKNFGVNASVFANLPTADPYILNGTVSTQQNVTGPNGALTGNSSYVYHTLQYPPEDVPGGGGTLYKVIDRSQQERLSVLLTWERTRSTRPISQSRRL